MRSKFLSLIFCIIAFGFTMAFVVNIIDPSNTAGTPDTSGKLTIEDENSPTNPETSPQNTAPVVDQVISEESVKAVASDVEKLFERLAYGSDKSYEEEFSKLYGGRGPVLTVAKIERADKPLQEVATFY